MTMMMTTLRSRFAWPSIAGLLVAIVGLVWVDGHPPLFAQTDTTAPSVSSVAISSDADDDGVYSYDDGVYGIGDRIEVTVTFSEDVTVTGSPQLELRIGSKTKNAAYKSTTGSKVVFSYTVAVGDSDPDGISIEADKIDLDGGSIKDGENNDADHSDTELSAQSGHKVDGIRPTITRVYFIGSSSGQDDVHTSGEWLPAGVSFSENIYVGGHPGPQLKLNLEGTTRYADLYSVRGECNEPICVSGSRGRYGKYASFAYTIVRGDLDLDGVAINANSVVLSGGSIRDGAGNDAVLTHSAVAEDSNFIVDAVPATVKSVAITSDPGSDNTYGVGDTIQVTVTFSESVRVPRWVGSNGVQMPLLELNVGGEAKIARTHERETITGTTLVFSYTVQDSDNDADGISIGANKLTTQGSYGITDNYGSCCPGGETADLRHSAVADDEEHKVSSSMPASLSADATLKGLTLSGIDFGTFASDTESYSATVAYGLSQTTVVPTVNHSGARYVTELGGVTDADGTVSLAVGSNVITVVVTAEDGSTSKTYTVTVTRAAPSTDATLKGLTLSGIDFGTFASDTESYSSTVAYGVAQTIVTPTLNHSGARYVKKIGGVLVPHQGPWRKVSLATGANVIAIEVTAEDGRTTKVYTVTVTREGASTDATLKGLTLSGVDFGTFASGTESYTAEVTNTPTETNVTPTVNHSGADYVIKLHGVDDADGTIPLAAGSNVITVEVTAEDGQTTKTYTVTVTLLVTSHQIQASNDASLSALTLSGIDIGTFASGTTSYTAQVASSVTETTVTPTVNHSEASYVIKLDGVDDDDGVISLAAGSNVITIEVTAEDDTTTRTYTVAVTRLVSSLGTQASSDATLSGLTLSGIDFGTFASGTTSYTAQVANSVSQTTVTPTVNHSGASYAIKLDGVEDSDGVVSLSVGSNVITIEVTAEDGETTQTYTVTVTRASAPLTDATLKWLKLSGIDIGDGPNRRTYVGNQTSFKANVYHSISQTTVTPTVNHSGASYVIKLGGVEDADGAFSLAVGSNVITVEVTAEDDSTTQTYTATVNRAMASAPTTGELSTDDRPVNFRAIYVSKTFAGFALSYPRNRGLFGWVGQRYEHDGDNFVSSGADSRYEFSDSEDLGGSRLEFGDDNVEPGALYKWVAMLKNSQGSTVIETSVTVRIPPDETTELSSDATLSALTLTGMELEKTGGLHAVVEGFDSTHLSYAASVANSVSQTTVAPTVNHSGASYVIKLNGVTDEDGIISLSVGNNSITIEVTAEDGETTRTYTVAVTRTAAVSTDATLSDLALSGVDFGTFASATASYTASVANSVSQTTVTPTVNHSGASYIIKLDGVTDADGVVSLSVGSNVITVEVTAEDDSTTQLYTLTVTRAAPPSTDATLGALTLSGIDFGTFDSTTTSYTAQVANSVSQTTVTPTVNHSGASYVIKLGGVADADRAVSLSVGSNVITVGVTAEDSRTTQTYTITVTRAAPPSTDATLSALTLSGIDFGTFASGTTSYSAQVANSVSQTTVAPTVNDSGAGFVIKLGGVTDVDGVVSLSVGSNVITVEVTAEDDSTTRTYTVTVTHAVSTTPEQPSSDSKLSALTLSGIDFGTFDSTTTSYSARVANSVSQTTVIPTLNHSGASYVIKLGGVTDTDGVVSLAEGTNVITIEVTAEDGNTAQTYTVTVTRAAPPSTDATLSALTLSDIDFGTFAPGTTSYTTEVANSVSQTTVSPTPNHSGASYVIKLDGASDADGVIELGVGSNVITVEVTAQDGLATRTYTVTVTRAAQLSSDATLSSLTLSGIDFGTFDPTTNSYRARVASEITETTVTPAVNHSAASYVIKLGGVMDADGVVSLSEGSNVITVDVTAEDGETTQTYTVTVARGPSPCLTGGAVSESTNTGLVSDCDTLLAARDTLAGTAILNWSADTLIGKWEGVTLRGTLDRIVGLTLTYKGMDGEIPSELGDLSMLAKLDLRSNQLSGSIPSSLGRLSRLTRLNLRSNQLSGSIPGSLGRLSRLTYLNLHSNNLSGDIPDLSETMLEELYLANNHDDMVEGSGLTGPVPAWLNGMVSMRDLWLWGNRLSGPIPDLSGMSSLQKLKLSGNNLTGGIPAELSGLSSLTYLILHQNRLTGVIPTGLSDLSDLKWLSLYGNELTGGIPAELGELTNLKRLYLNHNDLTGGILAELSGLSSLTHLTLQHNRLTGVIPTGLSNLTNLEWLSLYGNE